MIRRPEACSGTLMWITEGVLGSVLEVRVDRHKLLFLVSQEEYRGNNTLRQTEN